MAFSIGSILNKETLEQGKDTHRVQYLNYTLIKPNENNSKYYLLTGIEALAWGILDKGLLEPLVVTKNQNDNTYIIISGHRRYAALSFLIEKGYDEFKLVPCIVRDVDLSNDEMLIDGNVFNRQLSPAQRAKELNTKMRILKERKEKGEKVSGKLLEIIAKEMDISYHQAKKLNSINLNASDNTKDAFEQGKLSVEAAYELSKFDTQTQNDIIEKNGGDNITVNDIKKQTEVKAPLYNNSAYEDTKQDTENKAVSNIDVALNKKESKHPAAADDSDEPVYTVKKALYVIESMKDSINQEKVTFADKSVKSVFTDNLKYLVNCIKTIDKQKFE